MTFSVASLFWRCPCENPISGRQDLDRRKIILVNWYVFRESACIFILDIFLGKFWYLLLDIWTIPRFLCGTCCRKNKRHWSMYNTYNRSCRGFPLWLIFPALFKSSKTLFSFSGCFWISYIVLTRHCLASIKIHYKMLGRGN